MSLIIGSTAIKYYYPEFPREPKDIDVAVLTKKGLEGNRVNNTEFLENPIILEYQDRGHKYDLKLLERLREYWEGVHPKVKRSNLEQGKEDFFTNNVNQDTEEHDFLHTLIADPPAYTKILKDGAEVELDENKWNNLSFREKCDVVFEEAAVMGWERYNGKMHYVRAYNRQLKDNIRKHYPIFIALFAIENYKELEKPKFNYFNKIENGLQVSI